ncbi:MAG: response regulator transcription factor [Fusobacterium sp.]|jgi:two-component system copper resistance phosphate regulon response regulator CusR|uniref:response regulator transcription factor n=1 Tax=Fusobacterium sp. TaxID=68766 RepID=UPI0029422745|nr:response regulator transcription factor [Fusobacterium sp.]MDY3058406.1 response regulator transcription factor [Fusobacterium sp.]MEE1475287.1 response regulator transcription factor [Fusobacterium sp.]
MNILIVQRDREIQKYLKKGLKELGYTVEICSDRDDAYYHIKSDNYDLAILDIDIENGNGIELCSEIREINKKIGIIFLSSENDIEKKVQSLDSGADDYITKPFSFIELAGRIRAILRRCKGNINKIENNLTIKNLKLDLLTREAKRGDREIELTYREFALLEYLIRNKNLVLSRTMIREKIWNMNYTANTNIVDVYMTHLRNKIDKGEEEKIIYTVRGVGYILKG